MRDLLIVSIVILSSLIALRRPWIGVLCWTWLSIMNPHRYTFGFAYHAPLAAIAAASTLLGVLIASDRESPFKGTPVGWFAAFMVWMTLSWLFGYSIEGDYPQWVKVMKVDFMILVALAAMRTKQHVLALAWVVTGSLALLGIKGGIFTITSGGAGRVWGPPGSFIEDNNEFGLALIMTIPMLQFLYLQVQDKWRKTGLVIVMLLCAASALGSQSRGALLAISAMAVVLWWRGRSRIVGGAAIAFVAAGLVSFMPDTWMQRMDTIQTYEEDRSAMGRISAWWNAWGVAKNYFTGAGFDAGRPEYFALYSPYPDYIHAAHSIYFQVMGNHGFVGLALFLAIFITTWRQASWIRVQGARQAHTRWCSELAAMCQVSLAGYAVGGAFLSLAYFDLPYNIVVLVVLTRVWMLKEQYKVEGPLAGRIWRWLGMVPVEAKQEPAGPKASPSGRLHGGSAR